MAAVPSIGRAVRIEGAAAPEADLTRALYEEYGNQIFRYCLHQLGSREEAEDAVQSTFLNAFRGIKRGIVPELESAWLFKIAHNVCLSRRRTSWRRGRIESPTDFDVVEELTPAPSRRSDELMGLQDVLEQMPENQRRAILLREWQGLSYREIAEELELSQAAVETLIFRARRSLAAGLEQPPEVKRRVLVRGADLGNIVAGLKSLLIGGGAAAKVAATVAVVSASTVVVAAPVQQHYAQAHHPVAPPAPKTHAVTAKAHSTAVVHASVSAAPAVRRPLHVSRAHGTPGHVSAAVHVRVATPSVPDEGAVATPAPEAPAPAAPVEPTPAPVTEAPAQPEPQHAAPAPAAPADRPKDAGAPAAQQPGNDSKGGDPKAKESKGSDNGKGSDHKRKESSAVVVLPVATTPVGPQADTSSTVTTQSLSAPVTTAAPVTTDTTPTATVPVDPTAATRFEAGNGRTKDKQGHGEGNGR